MTSAQVMRQSIVAGMASLVLAMPVTAQATSVRDSLGLQALNEALRLIPGELSIDLTRGRLTAQAPRLSIVGVGSGHMVWGDSARRDARPTFVFAWDSGGVMSRAISSRSPLVEVELIIQYNTLPRLLPYTTAFAQVAEQLGPPDFCERDTAVLLKDNGIHLSTMAVWRRGTVLVSMFRYMNYITLPPEIAPYTRRFGVAFRASRTTDRWTSRGDLPTRHDSPCLVTDAEFLEHEQPMQDDAFRALREQLRQRVPPPPLP